MKKTLFTTMAMAALLGPVAFSAQKPSSSSSSGTASAKPAATASARSSARLSAMHAAHGKIVSINDNSLVASIGRGKDAKDTTFMLNADTKREGNPTAGEMVKIEYHEQGTDKVATLVQVQPLKTTAQSKPRKSTY